MPTQRKQKCQNHYHCSESCKESADLRCLAGGDHIRWQVLKNVLQITNAGCRVVRAAGQIGDLFQRSFIYFPAETIPARAGTKSATVAKEVVLLELIAAIHHRSTTVGAKTDRIYAHTACHGLCRRF